MLIFTCLDYYTEVNKNKKETSSAMRTFAITFISWILELSPPHISLLEQPKIQHQRRENDLKKNSYETTK